MNNRLLLPILVAATLSSTAAMAEKEGRFYLSGNLGSSKVNKDPAEEFGLNNLSDVHDAIYRAYPDTPYFALEDLTSSTKSDNKGMVFSFQVGYFVTENLALEIGYVDLGEVKGSTALSIQGEVDISPDPDEIVLATGTASGTVGARAGADGFTVGLNLHLPTPIDRVDLNLLLGAVRWDSQSTYDVSISSSAVIEGIDGQADVQIPGDAFGKSLGSVSDSGTDPYYGLGVTIHEEEISLTAKYIRYDIGDVSVDTFTVGLTHIF